MGQTPPRESQPDTKPLSRGKFHASVQSAFLAGLPGTAATPEKTITLSRTRNGRMGLLVVPQGSEAAAVVVEIKSTDWDSVTGVLLYPRRPNDPSRGQLVEDLADREALMVVWYSETGWKEDDLSTRQTAP